MSHSLSYPPFVVVFCTVFLAPLIAPLTTMAAESDSTSIESIPLKAQASHVHGAAEDVQWSGTSVTVIDQAEIEATYRRTLEDLEGYVPGLVVDPISGTPQGAAIGLRGIHSNNPSKGFEPAVAVSIDGVYVGTHAAQNQTLFDFEQIEIARGPQGTFNGAPAEGGSINMIRSKPTGELGLKTRISAGEFKGRDLDAILNFPVTAGLAGKVTINHQKRDGKDLKNTFSDRRENGIDRTAYALSLLWQARDNVTVQYTIDIDRDDSDTPGLLNFSGTDDLVCVPDPINAPAIANCASVTDARLPESNNPQRFLQNFSNKREFESDSQIIRIDAEYKNLQITSITGLRSTKEQFSQDFDGTFVDKFSSTFDSDYDQVSTDLRVSGQYSDNLSYTVGGYYLQTEYDLTRNDLFLLDTLITAGRVFPIPLAGQTSTTQSSQKSSTLSAFGYAKYQYDEQWILDAGVRFARFEKDFDHRIAGIDRVLSAQFPNTDQVIFGDKDFNEVAGHLGASYKVDESAMVYGRYAVDHTPGGFSDAALSILSADHYETTTTQSLELGMKSHWLEDRLRLNMAFYNNYQNDKVQLFADRVANGNIEYRYDNVSDIEVRGFDLEVEYAATENLYLRGSWGHIANSYSFYRVPNLTLPGEVLDLQFEPERSPENTFYLNGQYSIPYRWGTFNLFAGYRFFDSYHSNPAIATGRVRRHSSWDASIEYAWDDYQVRLFSQNINDKRFIVNIDQSFDAQYVPLLSTFTATQGVSTVADLNSPRYTGVEFIWTPVLSR
ncbi:MAG: iron complex outermembrane receptor protein [Candidatus Azotimanducaceae bacterium]|jgi:iron complex outermembrane receptor protein